MSDIDKRIDDCLTRIAQGNKAKAILKELYSNKTVLDKKTARLKSALDKENKDLEKLEGYSFSKVIFTISCNLVEKKDKEKREAIEAKLKYDQAVVDAKHNQSLIEQYEAKVADLAGSEQEYQELLKEKRKLILMTCTAESDELFKLIDDINVHKSNLIELTEALEAGSIAQLYAEKCLAYLISAGDWGYYRSGLIAADIKHEYIDMANAEMRKVHTALVNFKAELTDIEFEIATTEVEIGDFAKFADFFIGGFIADLFVMNKIDNSTEAVEEQVKSVKSIMQKLRVMRDKYRTNIKTLEELLEQKTLKLSI